jgi:hypothetical protein
MFTCPQHHTSVTCHIEGPAFEVDPRGEVLEDDRDWDRGSDGAWVLTCCHGETLARLAMDGVNDWPSPEQIGRVLEQRRRHVAGDHRDCRLLHPRWAES